MHVYTSLFYQTEKKIGSLPEIEEWKVKDISVFPKKILLTHSVESILKNKATKVDTINSFYALITIKKVEESFYLSLKPYQQKDEKGEDELIGHGIFHHNLGIFWCSIEATPSRGVGVHSALLRKVEKAIEDLGDLKTLKPKVLLVRFSVPRVQLKYS